MCAGANIVWDEDGCPFSPFLHPDILEQLKLFHKHNYCFGIRFHGGENVANKAIIRER